MSELATSILVVFSEIGVVFAIIFGAAIVFLVKRFRGEKQMAKTLVAKLRKSEPERKEKLLSVLKENLGMNEKEANFTMEALNACEKSLYSRVIKVFLGKDRNSITDLNKDVEALVKGYQNLVSSPKTELVQSHSDMAAKEENKKLRVEKLQLKKDLDNAMETMESMMGEYASMYEGGKKEGEQRMKNEMHQLKQKLSEKVSKEEIEKDLAEDLPNNKGPEASGQ